MNSLLHTLLEEFHERIMTLENGIHREVTLPNIPNKIMVAIGMRRTGKTYFLFQIIKALVKKKISLKRILYINFEDDRFYPMSQEKLRQLLDGFYSLYPENYHQECYLFLDEIQNVDHWHQVIRRYFDSKKVKLYLTGSSAKLLSKEIATSLRGRSIATEIWPFSFTEFLQTKQLSLPDTFGKIHLDKFTAHLRNFIENGGFPEITANQPLLEEAELVENHRRILQDYVSVVIIRDIVERHQISNATPLRYIVNFLLKNAGGLVSINKLYNDLKSQGFEISKDSVYHYLSYIEDSYLAFLVPIYSESIRVVQTNPRKIYAIDTGLANAYNMGFKQNIGHYFENLIFLDLRRARHEIYYYRTQTRQGEVDFLSKDSKGTWHLWQVCWNIEDTKTLDREMSALQAAEKELKLSGTCITPHSYFSEFLPSISLSLHGAR